MLFTELRWVTFPLDREDEGAAFCQMLEAPGGHMERQEALIYRGAGQTQETGETTGLSLSVFLCTSFSPLSSSFCTTSSSAAPFLLSYFLFSLSSPVWFLRASASILLLPEPLFLTFSASSSPAFGGQHSPPQTLELGVVYGKFPPTLWRVCAQTEVIPVHGECFAQISLWPGQ